MTQIRTHLALLGKPLPIWHTVELLDAAYTRHGLIGGYYVQICKGAAQNCATWR